MSARQKDIQMVDVLGQYGSIREEIDAAIREVLDSGLYINGPWVKKFQANLANAIQAKHVIACANGTDALQIALMALGLQPGDEVITSPFTFFATAEVISLLGLRPVFVDVHPHTFNIDASLIEAAITPRTRVILPVHLYGQTADMEPILKIAHRHGLYVVEDAAQSIGSAYTFSDGRVVYSGLMGNAGSTSFFPSKNLGAYGDAGAIFTQDDALAETIQSICHHGSRVKYFHERIGVNSRLDSLQAVILDVKLKYLGRWTEARRAAAQRYDALLSQAPGILTPACIPASTHVYHQYTLRITAGQQVRDALKKSLAEAGIPSMIYYPVPLHLQEAYRPYNFAAGDFPVAEKLSGEVLSLPMHSELDEAQTSYIAEAVLNIYNKLI